MSTVSSPSKVSPPQTIVNKPTLATRLLRTREAAQYLSVALEAPKASPRWLLASSAGQRGRSLAR